MCSGAGAEDLPYMACGFGGSLLMSDWGPGVACSNRSPEPYETQSGHSPSPRGNPSHGPRPPGTTGSGSD